MRKFGIGILVVVCGLVAAGVYVTRDIPATHPVLRNSALPPLIPTRAFYADPRAEFGYVASSDGKYVSLEKASLLGRKIVVREVASGKDIAEFPVDISYIRWHPSKHLLRFIHRGHDWEADPFNPSQENWKRISPIKLSGGWVKNTIATDKHEKILAWGKAHKRSHGNLFLVSQDGLDAEQIAEGNANTQYWAIDQNKRPVLRIDSLGQDSNRVYRKVGSDWEHLVDIHLDDSFIPFSHVRTDGTALVRSSRGRDKAVLAEFSVSTGEEKVILANPNADIGWHTALTHKQEPDLIRLGVDTLERKPLTDRGKVFLDILAQFPQPVSVGSVKPTASGRYITAAISPREQSYVYLLIDLEEKNYVVLGEYHFRRFKEHLVQGKTVHFRARDGKRIPAIMTMPEDVSGPIPFIVDIHGGPAGQSFLGYDHDLQFLVNRGYGVLSVNFRGSTGFGKEFQAAGFKQFGRAMQDDITDAANWLVEQKLADPDALVAMGTSYGGYSAALSMMRDPGLFNAAIVEFPMLDPEFQTKYHPGFWEQGMHGWWRYFGKLDNENDLALMRQYSPSNLINRLHGPLLILAGVQDEITAVQQVRDFEAKALEAKKDVDVHYFAEVGHGIDHWRDKLRRARLIEDFLAERLGGRSGGFEFVEWAPEFIE